MLTERLTDSRWVISLYDNAIPVAMAAGVITDDQVYKYAQSRDLADLGGIEAVKKWIEPPTLFKLKPMTTRHQVMEDRADSLFSLCCEDMDNVPISWKRWAKSATGSYLEEEALEKIPRGIVTELGALVREMATKDGGDYPFTPPDGWGQSLIVTRARAALRARAAAPAKEPVIAS